jgi:putative N6-adenine-specific DNA methylase
LLCNPPYGERIGDEEQAMELYKNMDSLWQDFPNWDLGIITSHKKFQESFGHYATQLKNLKAGNLDTVFHIYKR